ncbi:DgyrCDS5693 [Dimorphilus gyrociliatus]|uniref:DgyrCDS5693 n=1 Tax=Dimorphilus gyrociliatus TaxID=2664684 RepID=A0A7I8VKN5_9ANNE|nr:DgyrCDS5693 [Dimorphilus gyrociliatus]
MNGLLFIYVYFIAGLQADLLSKTLLDPYKITDEESRSLKEENSEVRGGFEDQSGCITKECSIGHECRLDDFGKPFCACAESCPNDDPNAFICTNQNISLPSECELHRIRCMCKKRMPQCADQSFSHIHLDYYGPCRQVQECSEEDLSQFPKRLKEWFEDVADFLETDGRLTYRQAKKTSAAIWKFCDLDLSKDRILSHREMRPLITSLKGFESCIKPFLHQCDDDSDDEITLEEWTTCLGIDSDNVEDLCGQLSADEDTAQETK